MLYDMTHGGYMLKRGYTRDPECHRTTYRLQEARAILRTRGIEPEWEHSGNVGLVGTGLLAREAHVCDGRCEAVWPEWVTDEVFDLAFALADEIQTRRGEWNRARAQEYARGGRPSCPTPDDCSCERKFGYRVPDCA